MGQRWVSNTESDLGLGMVLEVDLRTVTMAFPATDETRTYAQQSAPLTRAEFRVGDSISSQSEQNLVVKALQRHEGLISYRCQRQDGSLFDLDERLLSAAMQLNSPAERLFSGQMDNSKWFELRYQTLQQQQRLAQSELFGLVGVRTSLLPHQLYIAHEVANRFAPRVLLADEVGLGKTIEAGLILHQQLLTGRAKRVLIIVPETLLHQWLVEMLRRFSLRFSIFDEERCQAIEESSGIANPFEAEQLVLCSLGFISRQKQRFQQSLAASWDLLIVDEAHHLQWSSTQSSVEYDCVKALAAAVQGVLLLTATPEQLGKSSHFARLHILDPDRFDNYQEFVKEEESYRPIADVVENLLSREALSESSLKVLESTVAEGDNLQHIQTLRHDGSSEQDKAAATTALINHLIDRHGTGRVLFRNTRANIHGFPQRRLNAYPLSLPAAYATTYAQYIDGCEFSQETEVAALLYPERLYVAAAGRQASAEQWTQLDPRVDWLIELVKGLRPEKILIIAANAATVLELARALKTLAGIHAPVFHEGLSIIERDRAAAHFADVEVGSQVLICSEIGSEGRNFQFASQLVLFDLPLNPDVLEQRIGRLDRIGQASVIDIHVPYFEPSPQSILFAWYHSALDAFENICQTGQKIYADMSALLFEALLGYQQDQGLSATLIERAHNSHCALMQELQHGRDKLLEYNSCRPDVSRQLVTTAGRSEDSAQIQSYLDAVYDCFGVESEIYRGDSLVIRPASDLKAYLPYLEDRGMTITYHRETALANEDIEYISWEHPFTLGVMDTVLSSEQGNAVVSVIRTEKYRPGSLLLECVYALESLSPIDMASRRYFPPISRRLVVDENGNDHSNGLTHQLINASLADIDVETAREVVSAKASAINTMLSASEAIIAAQIEEIVKRSFDRAQATLSAEIQRLKGLQTVNKNIRDDEISYFEDTWSRLEASFNAIQARLDALRVIITI